MESVADLPLLYYYTHIIIMGIIIPMERDVSATGGNPSSEDEVPTSVSRGAKLAD